MVNVKEMLRGIATLPVVEPQQVYAAARLVVNQGAKPEHIEMFIDTFEKSSKLGIMPEKTMRTYEETLGKLQMLVPSLSILELRAGKAKL